MNRLLKKYGHLIKDWEVVNDDDPNGKVYYLYLKKPYVSDCEGYVFDQISGYIGDLEYWLKKVWQIDPAEWDRL